MTARKSIHDNNATKRSLRGENKEKDEADFTKLSTEDQYFSELNTILNNPDPKFKDDELSKNKVEDNIKSKSKDSKNINKNPSWIYSVKWLILILPIILIGVYLQWTNKNPNLIETFNLTKSIESIEKLHPTQKHNTWKYFQVGLESVLNFSRPSIFMLAHHNSNRIATKVVNKMAYTASLYLNPGSDNAQPLLVLHHELHLKDHRELLQQYEEEFKKNRVMVIGGIEKVPGIVAQGFRYFCDEYNPIAENSAVFFTIDLSLCPNYIKQEDFKTADTRKVTIIIEECLEAMWKSELDTNVIQPVLTRIIGIVLKILPE